MKHIKTTTMNTFEKKHLLKSIEDLPDKFSLDELLDKLIFIHKIETGLEQSKNGQLTSHEDVAKKFGKYLS